MVSRLKDTLLLVGDRESDRSLLREIFAASYDLLEAENVPQAQLLLSQNINCIAAVLADLPHCSEKELRELAAATLPGREQEVPLLVFISPDGTGEKEELAYALGATDVVYKPYTPHGVQRHLQVLVDLYLHKWHLERLAAEQSQTIRNTNQVMLDALGAIIEHRSAESGNHALRIRRFTKFLLEDVAACYPEYGLSKDAIDSIASASTLHDIGKISIPDSILNKPGKLTVEEYEIMKTHSATGGELVRNLSGFGDDNFLRYAYNIALYHHERWDGLGYPLGLKGDDIPICAQVVGLADAFDALTTTRAYKPAFSYEQAINMILNGECGTFSPKLLECFKHVRDRFVALAHQYSDGYSPKSDHITMPLPAPVWQKPQLNSLQLSQIKYQTLLHYINDTVIEFDLDSKLYHVVYNPNPDFEPLLLNAPYEQVTQRLLNDAAHPDDREEVVSLLHSFSRDFLALDLRRKMFRCRLYSSSMGEYLPYEISLLRVNTQNADQRIVIVVFHKVDSDAPGGAVDLNDSPFTSPALYGLVSSALRCRSDKNMTIDAGAHDLYPLTGYTTEEIAQNFDNHYIKLVHPDDRSAFLSSIQKLSDVGGKAENGYRLLRKDGGTLWVLDKSRTYVEADGQEYVYRAVRDNSASRSAFHRLQSAVDRNQVIIDQSGDIVFEWDLQSDTMYCSPRWKDIFGYTPLSLNYGAQMGIATHFHPDDLPTVRNAVEQIKEDKSTISVEVRIADANAKYLWMKIIATAYLDENGVLGRIVGIIQDIDTRKRAELALIERAEHDALTKLLNKASSQHLVEEYLAKRAEDSLSAMLILDLDNFKLINDRYGHLYGDTVLSQCGAALKKLFRSHDIIGRIGGDEFLVFLCNIPNAELVHSRCALLLETLQALLKKNVPDLNVSCSIGAALVPEHGVGYTDLFRRADEALYRSKNRGKNTYTIYDPREQSLVWTADSSMASTRIDSDEQPGMADASFVQFVFHRLYESRDILSTIDEILSYVGSQLNVSRVYIFENNDDNTTCSNTFEWCNEGVSPEKDNLQNVNYTTDIPGWLSVYDERGIFYCTDITSLKPQFRAILEPQGIKSMLQCSIRDNGVFRGYVGFDECFVNRMWTQDQIDLLEFLAEVLALFLLKKRSQDKLAALAENLNSILERQTSWNYVIDPKTCKLKFLNAKTRQLAPKSKVGMVCYRAFMGRSSRCENCPAKDFEQTKGGSAVIENPKFNLRIHAAASEITWNGEPSCLITCHELTKET